jgi:retron-type reverse transcriptase
MKTKDPFLAVHNLGLLQRQAGVDPQVAELVTSYAKLLTNAGKPLDFKKQNFEIGSIERKLFDRLARKNPKMDQKFLSFLASYGGMLSRRGLPIIYNKDHFCQTKHISKKYLMWICNNQRKCYREFRIPKKNGRHRVILAPNKRLRSLQKWILHRILNQCTPHSSAQGFIQGKSIVSNAVHHTDKKVIVRIDIENFFPSITFTAVRRVFQKLGYPYSVAILLSNLCTVDGKLPQGASTSPALSNLVCERLDRRISSLSQKLNFSYTRYADDLIFSSNNARLPKLIPFFREILQEEGFRLNESKTRIMRPGQRQIVTGIVTNKRPNLTREHVRKLRAAVHRLRTQGPSALELPSRKGNQSSSLQVLRGHLSLLQMVHPDKAKKLKACLHKNGEKIVKVQL